MAKLNIAERRLPQDGRIRIAIRGRDIDLRVSTMPTLHGESVVMRILDRSSLVEDFAVLGFEPDTLKRYLDLLDQPQGILLVTGPTGSGKTTTLYTSLLRLNTPEKKIFTVEDPIEYQLDGINQIQVKPQIGLTFAADPAHVAAPGSRRHHDRRDARSRDGADRDPGGAHRPSRAVDLAHQQRRRARSPVCSTWGSRIIW